MSDDDLLETNRDGSTSLNAMFVMISSSRDSEKAAGIKNGGGVFSLALLETLKESESSNLSWFELIERIRTKVKEKGFSTQLPQLSCSRPLNVFDPFTIVPKRKKDDAKRHRKRAILVGINYVDQPDIQLTGCHNDVLNMQKYLVEKHGFDERDMALFLDDGKHYAPTKENIEKAFDIISMQSDPGDVVFFHYAGHGRQYEDIDGDEVDGFDEAILPCDFQTAGAILDDNIYNRFVKPMREGVYALALLDCCHSGTGMDLPYVIKVGEDKMSRSGKALNLATTIDLTPQQKSMRRSSNRHFKESFDLEWLPGDVSLDS